MSPEGGGVAFVFERLLPLRSTADSSVVVRFPKNTLDRECLFHPALGKTIAGFGPGQGRDGCRRAHGLGPDDAACNGG